MANLRKQHLWGVITDEEFRREYVSLERQKKPLEAARAPVITPNLDKSAHLLSDLPMLWQHPGVTAEQRRDLAREVFEEIRLREGKLAAVKPRPNYAPLFAYSVWRYNVVGGDQSSWAQRRISAKCCFSLRFFVSLDKSRTPQNDSQPLHRLAVLYLRG